MIFWAESRRATGRVGGRESVGGDQYWLGHIGENVPWLEQLLPCSPDIRSVGSADPALASAYPMTDNFLVSEQTSGNYLLYCTSSAGKSITGQSPGRLPPRLVLGTIFDRPFVHQRDNQRSINSPVSPGFHQASEKRGQVDGRNQKAPTAVDGHHQSVL